MSQYKHESTAPNRDVQSERYSRTDDRASEIARDLYMDPVAAEVFANRRNQRIDDDFTITDAQNESFAPEDARGAGRPTRVGSEQAEKVKSTLQSHWKEIEKSGDGMLQKRELIAFLQTPAGQSMSAEEKKAVQTAIDNFYRIRRADNSTYEQFSHGITKNDLARFPESEKSFEQGYAAIDYMQKPGQFKEIAGEDGVVTRPELQAYTERRRAEGADEKELQTLDYISKNWKPHFREGYAAKKEGILNFLYNLNGKFKDSDVITGDNGRDSDVVTQENSLRRPHRIQIPLEY